MIVHTNTLWSYFRQKRHRRSKLLGVYDSLIEARTLVRDCLGDARGLIDHDEYTRMYRVIMELDALAEDMNFYIGRKMNIVEEEFTD